MYDEIVLGDRHAVRASYDAVARPYADRFLSELDHKPLDRALLAWFADMVRGAGPVADLGSGPGQITRHLHELGTNVFGVDLSPGMVSLAHELHQDRAIDFRVGDFQVLDLPNASLAGTVAFLCVRARTDHPSVTCVLGATARAASRRAGAVLVPCRRGDRSRRALLRAAGRPRFHFFSMSQRTRCSTRATRSWQAICRISRPGGRRNGSSGSLLSGSCGGSSRGSSCRATGAFSKEARSRRKSRGSRRSSWKPSDRGVTPRRLGRLARRWPSPGRAHTAAPPSPSGTVTARNATKRPDSEWQQRTWVTSALYPGAIR